MSRPVHLETFALGQHTIPPVEPVALMKIRQAAYEEGHRDGWRACEGESRAAEIRMRESVGAHLQTIAFGYEEAHDHILRGLAPVLREIITKVLPEIAQETLLPKVLEQLMASARLGASRPVIIRVPPGHQEAADALLQSVSGLPFEVRACADLDSGRAVIGTETGEHEVDLTGAIAEIAAAVAEFFQDHRPIPALNPDIHND
jgi:flagellar assembly protein FliH